jgi:hypothetical protein
LFIDTHKEFPMPHLHRVLPLLLGVALLLAALPTAAPAAPPGCTLHPKSAAGLMPPVCLPDPLAPSVANDLPEAAFLGEAINTNVGSWAQVLATGPFGAPDRNRAAVLTAYNFDPANDEQVHLYELGGVTLNRLQRLPAGADPVAAVALDTDHSGEADLVAAFAGADQIAVFPPAASGLGAPQRTDLPGAPDALAVGDIDGDLRNDLIVALPMADTITLWRTTPDGLEATGISLPFPNDGYTALVVGDFDNDGYDDIAALRGSGDPSGTRQDLLTIFLQADDFAASFTLSPQTGGFLPHALAVGDMNGDGLDDLVVTAGGNQPNAFLNVYLQGAAGLATIPITLNTYHLPSAVQVADVNHDGRDDVIIAHDGWRYVSVFTQRTNGTLDPAYVARQVPYSSHYRPHSLAVADLNGDGGLDVALVSRTPGLTTLTNTAPAPTSTITAPAAFSTVQPGTLVVSGTLSANAPRLEVRAKGITGWVAATVSGASWTAELELPEAERPVWIEARAISAAGRYQAPHAQVRVQIGPWLVGYAVAHNTLVDGSPDYLVRFDPLTATSELVGPTGTAFVRAIAFLPGSATLFAVDANYFGTLDPLTGTFTPMPQPLGQGRNGSTRVTFRTVHGLTAEPATGLLLATMRRDGAPDILFKIDPANGQFVPNAFGSGRDFVSIRGAGVDTALIEDLVYAADGTLYAIASKDGREDQLITLHPQTGAATLVGTTGIPTLEGLDIAPNGLLYGSSGSIGFTDPTSDKLWQVDPATGAVTLIGAFGMQSDYESIAFVPQGVTPPPAPSAAALGLYVAPATQAGMAQVQLSGANPAANVLLVEYRYDVRTGAWVAAQEGAQLASELPASALSTGVHWQLQPNAGIRYFLAWSGDAPTAALAQFNYIPPTLELAAGEVAIYRYQLAAGARLVVELTSVQGDADLLVWSDDPAQPVRVSNSPINDDAVSFKVPADGLYQVEIHAPAGAMTSLRVSIDQQPTDADPAETSQGVDAVKTIPNAPVVDLRSMPDRTTRPGSTITNQQRIFLPLLR